MSDEDILLAIKRIRKKLAELDWFVGGDANLQDLKKAIAPELKRASKKGGAK